MNFFKRALIHVQANIGKSILILLIFLITMGAVSTAFMSLAMYNKTLTATFDEGTVPVKVDNEYPEGLIGRATYDWNVPRITVEDYLEIANLEQIVETKIAIETQLVEDQLALPDDIEVYGGLSVSYTDVPDSFNSYTRDATEFSYDKDQYKNDPNSVIVSDQILASNDLEVGDQITLDLNSSYGKEYAIDELSKQQITIVGSYSAAPTQEMIENEQAQAAKYDFEPDLTFSYLYTEIFLPFAKGEEIEELYQKNGMESYENPLHVDATYYLSSLDEVDGFEKAVEDLIGIQVDVDFDTNEVDSEMVNGLSIIESIMSLVKYFIYFGVLIVIVLLTIIITLFIRGRKKEIGIMLALGETRRNVYLQLVFEQVIIMGIATIISYPICLAILSLLASKYGFIGLGFTVIPLLKSIGIGIIIIGLITLIPTIYTMRVNPKKILL